MIVVMIIGILSAIAMPQWIRARATARTNSCLENLRKTEEAKDLYAMENHKSNGDTATQANLVPNYIKVMPICPESGTITINVIGTPASCSVHGTP